MSLDLYQDQIQERMADMPPVQVPEAGVFDGFLRGAGMATMRGFAQTARAIDLLGSVGPILKDAAAGDGTTLQDRYFREHEDTWQSAVDYWTPKPQEVGVAGEMVGQLLSVLPQVIISPGLAVGAMQLSTAEELSQRGVSSGQAQAVGALEGAVLATGIWMPILGNNLWQRALLGGAAANLGLGTVARGGAGIILEGTPAAEDFKAFDGTAMTLDVLMGLAFGGIAHLSPEMQAHGNRVWTRVADWAHGLPPSEKGAIAVLREAQHLNEDSLPGKPAGPQDIEAHVQRMRQAIDQLARDQPVNVEDVKVPAREAPPEAPGAPPMEVVPPAPATDPRFTLDRQRLEESIRRTEILRAEGDRVRAEEDIPPVIEREQPGPRLEVTREPSLTGELRDIEARFTEHLVRDLEGQVEAYKRISRPGADSNGGRILNTDIARELSPEYSASLESRARLARAVHEPASALVKELYRRSLEEAPREGEMPWVTFTAGGTGAGKTGAIARTALAKSIADRSHVIYDTNMNSVGSARKKIDQALAAGKQVNIIYVGRDPIEALHGAITRAKKIGRTVPVFEHAKTHIGAADTIQKLAEHYAGDDRVQIVYIDNAGAKGDVRVAGPELAGKYDLNNLEARLKEALDREHAKGNIPDAIYRGFAGDDAGAAGAGDRAGGGRVPAGEHGRGGSEVSKQGAIPREEVGGAGVPPAPGEKFLVFRLGDSGKLANRNAGNSHALARYIMGTEDAMGPISSKAGKVFAYEVTVDKGFGAYEGLTKGRAGKGAEVGRVVRDNEVAYSFPKEGYTAKVVGEKSLEELRAVLRDRGFENFDESGTIEGSAAIRQAFDIQNRTEGPPAQRAVAEPPPPPGEVKGAGTGGPEALVDENAVQADWLAKQAKEAGYASLDEMVAQDPAGFAKITEAWREHFPEGGAAQARDPVVLAADRFIERSGDRPIVIGTNADGTSITIPAREYLANARAEAARARDEVKLIEAAAGCYLGKAA